MPRDVQKLPVKLAILLKHSEAEFNHIAQQNKKYLAIIEITKEPNGVYEMEYEYIMEIFKEAMTKNDFL